MNERDGWLVGGGDNGLVCDDRNGSENQTIDDGGQSGYTGDNNDRDYS